MATHCGCTLYEDYLLLSNALYLDTCTVSKKSPVLYIQLYFPNVWGLMQVHLPAVHPAEVILTHV